MEILPSGDRYYKLIFLIRKEAGLPIVATLNEVKRNIGQHEPDTAWTL